MTDLCQYHARLDYQVDLAGCSSLEEDWAEGREHKDCIIEPFPLLPDKKSVNIFEDWRKLEADDPRYHLVSNQS